MKYYLIYSFGFFLLFGACTSKANKTNETEVPTEIATQEGVSDREISIQQKVVVFPDLLINPLKKVSALTLPFKADSSFFKKFKEKKLITDDEIKLLVSNFQKSKNYDRTYIYEVIRLNQLKEQETYEDYVENLDLAQLKDATAHWVGKIETGDTSLLLWAVKYGSYEACPFYSGTEIYCSTVYNGIILKSMKLGGYNSGGDAPVFGETFETFTINSDKTVFRRIHSAYYDDNVLQEKKASKDVIKLD